MVRDAAVGNVSQIPRLRGAACHVHHAGRCKQVRANRGIVRVQDVLAVDDEVVAVILGAKRAAGIGPNTVVALLHGEGIGIAF